MVTIDTYSGLANLLVDPNGVTFDNTGGVEVQAGVLSVGVGTWAFSPIKFQADMGLLLAFMFIWNMGGAMMLLPALVRFIDMPKAKESLALDSCDAPSSIASK